MACSSCQSGTGCAGGCRAGRNTAAPFFANSILGQVCRALSGGCAAGARNTGGSSASGCSCTSRCCTGSTSNTTSQDRQYCQNADGSGAYYNSSCRDPFWPEFAHPRWLSCQRLYSACR